MNDDSHSVMASWCPSRLDSSAVPARGRTVSGARSGRRFSKISIVTVTRACGMRASEYRRLSSILKFPRHGILSKHSFSNISPGTGLSPDCRYLTGPLAGR
jgi:hypothetical protein